MSNDDDTAVPAEDGADLRRLATSAKGLAPARRKSERLLTTPAETGAPAHFQLLITEEIRREFKIEAAARGMSASALFKELWAGYRRP